MAQHNHNTKGSSLECRSGASILDQAHAVAIAKTKLSIRSLIILSILAGAFIATGAFFMLLVKGDPHLSFAPSQILGGFCFSLGLVCVIVAGAELFTGNTLMVSAALNRLISWSHVFRNWVVVLIGNLIGSLIIVGLILGAQFGSLNGGAVFDAMISTAYTKASLSPEVILFRAILCNWLVCLAVWMSFAGKTVIDKIFTTIFPVMAFVACGFEHCVANMFLLPLGYFGMQTGNYSGSLNLDLISQTLTIGSVGSNIALAIVGNIIGGALMLGCAYAIAYKKRNAS